MSDMRSVWKFSIPIIDSGIPIFHIPIGAKLLHVREQFGTMAMWFEVDPDERLEERHFHLLLTGDNVLLSSMTYLGTGIFSGGQYVLHLYEYIPTKG